jgi:hypothetical protein
LADRVAGKFDQQFAMQAASMPVVKDLQQLLHNVSAASPFTIVKEGNLFFSDLKELEDIAADARYRTNRDIERIKDERDKNS